MSERGQSPEPTTPSPDGTASSPDQTTSLATYLAPLREYRAIVLLVTLVVAALGLLLAVAGPRTYTSTTSVLIYPVSADPTEALQASDRYEDMGTELRIAESRAVAEMAATELGELGVDVSPDTAASNIGVTNPEDSRVLVVSYQSSDPAVARVGSELATSAYLAYRSELNAASRQVARSAIDDEISVLQDRLTDVEERLELTAAGSSARLVVEVERTSIEGQLAAQQRALADLSTLSIDAATVFDTAREPSSADGLTVAQLLIGSLAGGLVLGVIAAWILAALGVEVGTDRLRRLEKPGRATRRQERQAEADADSPFDDSDNRDPLQLLKELEAVESDPRIALAAASAKRKDAEAATVEEPEPAENDEPSFAELYPNDFFDGGEIAVAEITTSDDEVEVDVDVATNPIAEITDIVRHEESTPDAGFGTVAQPLAEFDAAADLPIEIGHEVEVAGEVEGDVEIAVEVDAESPVHDPIEANDSDETVVPDALPTDPLEADTFGVDEATNGDAPHRPDALRGLGSLDTLPAVDRLPTLNPPSGQGEMPEDASEQLEHPRSDLLPQLAAIADGLAAQASAEAAEAAALAAEGFDADALEAVEAIDAVEATETIEAVEAVEAVDAIEATETIEAVEAVEATETIEAVEAVEATETIEAVEAVEVDTVEADPVVARAIDRSPLADPFEAAYDAAEVGLEYESSDHEGPGVEDTEQEPVDASLTTGDPNELDPGPPSWDGPFVGPTTWEQLSAMAAAAEGSTSAPQRTDDGNDLAPVTDVAGELAESETVPEPVPEPVAAQPAPPDLVAGNDVDTLFEQLADLGSAGPVAVLSLSDRNPAAGLTTGFELADELRAVGAHVLLIDARLDKPVLDTLFADGLGGGLAQVMTGEVVLDQAVRTLSGLDGLDLLTVGRATGETAGHLTGAPFHRLLSEARLNYHSIVIIGDAITPADPGDAIDVERSRALAAAVDGLIVGTNDPVGTVASPELADLLGSFDAPTLQLITAPVATAADTTHEATSV